MERNVSVLTQKCRHKQYGRRHLAPSGVEGQWEGGEDMEIYWTPMPEWLQPKILLNITHIIPVSGRWHNLMNWVTGWGQQCNTVTSLQEQCHLSHPNSPLKYTCIAIIHLLWVLGQEMTNQTNYTDKIHQKNGNIKMPGWQMQHKPISQLDGVSS